MQAEIRHALKRNGVLYNAVGFALVYGSQGPFFRCLSLILVSAVVRPPRRHRT